MDIALDKIKGFAATTIFSVLGGTVASGFLFIFIFKRTLFFTLDKFLLCLLAPSITLPILILNTGVFLISATKDGEKMEDETVHKVFSSSVFFGNLTTCVIVYFVILLGYFFNIQTRTGVIIITVVEVLIGCTIWISFRPKKKK